MTDPREGICFTNNSLAETPTFCTHILRTHPLTVVEVERLIACYPTRAGNFRK